MAGKKGGDIKFGDVIDAISEGSDIIYSKLKGIIGVCRKGEGREECNRDRARGGTRQGRGGTRQGQC